ncbi:MAG: protein kinase domain-containing protein [Candidatus Angelobacter sp.]
MERSKGEVFAGYSVKGISYRSTCLKKINPEQMEWAYCERIPSQRVEGPDSGCEILIRNIELEALMPEPAFKASGAARQHDLIGAMVGRFLIQRRLGSGGMGEVYLAEDTTLRRAVAIKRVSSGSSDVSRLVREGQRASALNHPNIASIYDVLEDRGEVLLVMEFVEGTTLREKLAGPMSPEDFLPIAIECAEALAAAHEKNILHSDIKPENIMLTSGGHVKLLDFGVARRVPGANDTTDSGSMAFSTMGPVGGTLAYMAPEVLLGGLPDLRADVFSLGLVCYEMLAGKHPFRGDSELPVGARIIQETAAALGKLNQKVPPPLADVIAKAMQRDPRERYASARPMAADLGLIQQGTKPVLAGGEKARPANRRAAAITAALLGLAAVLALSLLFTGVRAKLGLGKRGAGAQAAGVAAPVQQNLALLPMSVAGDDPTLKAFADGLTANLTSKLSQLSENHTLEVVSASQVRDKKVTTAQGAFQQFGANAALQMNLQKAGDMLRASYTLVESKSGRTLAGDTITVPASDPFALQDRVAGSVIHALSIQLRPDEQVAVNMHGTSLPAAYDYYLQGRGYLQDYSAQPERVDQAVQVLNQALKLDPNFGLAKATRGEAYWIKYQNSKNKGWIAPANADCKGALNLANAGAAGHVCLGLLNNGTGKYEEAVTEFQRALQLEPTNDDASIGLARAYTSLNRLNEAEETYQTAIKLRPNHYKTYSWLAFFYVQQAQYGKAAQIYEKLTSLAPENPEGYYNLGGTYLFLGREQDAITALEKSIKLRPSPAAYSNLGTAYFRARRFAEAATDYREALKSDQQNLDLWSNLGDAYFFGGQREQAITAFQKALDLATEQLPVNPKDASLQGAVATLYAQLGQKKKSLAHLDQALQLGRGDKESWFIAADVYNTLGETAVALECLQKAISAGYSRSTITKAPTFDNLRDNPRFQQLVAAK